MSLVGNSLVNAATPGAGSVLQFDTPKSVLAMSVVQTNTSGDGATVTLEGSLDGVNFYTIGSVVTSGQQVASLFSSNRLALYLRATLGGYTGSVNIDASVAAQE